MTFLAALAQIAPALGNLEKNIEKHIEYVQQAIDGDARLVVFPELSLTGYILRDMNFEVALQPGDMILEPFRALSKDITIILGGVEESQHYGVYNSAFVFDGGNVTTFRKVYPPDYGIFEEGRYFLHGQTSAPIATRLGSLGVLVCEDLWHLSLPLLQALEGAHTICVISASPTRLLGKGGLTNHQLNTQHHAAIARLLSVNLLFVNRVGYEEGVNFWGGSQLVNAFGDVVVAANGHDETLLFAEVKEQDVRRARRLSRHFLDEDPHFMLRELTRIVNG